MRLNTKLLAMWAGAAMLACASVPKPTEGAAQSEAAMRSAKELGAEQVPKAALHLKLAEDELEKARALMKDDKNDQATQMVMRSRSDAELAVALTRRNQAEADARGAEEQLQKTQEKAQ